MSNCLVFLCVFVSFVTVIRSCAPYFNDPRSPWQGKKENFEPSAASAECTGTYAVTASHVSPTGAQYCTAPKIFAGRWFCAKTCESECKKDASSSLEKIECQPLRTEGDGLDPSKLFVVCVCTYSGVECKTKETTWADVESQFTAECAGGASNTTDASGASNAPTDSDATSSDDQASPVTDLSTTTGKTDKTTKSGG